MLEQYYKLLNATQSDSHETIKKKYRSLVNQWHPDKPDGNAEKFKQINEAYKKIVQYRKNENNIIDYRIIGNPTKVGEIFELKITKTDAKEGGNIPALLPVIVTCRKCKGTGQKNGPPLIICPKCGGDGKISTKYGEFDGSEYCDRCNGLGGIIQDNCNTCSGTGRAMKLQNINVKIPKNIKQNTILNIKGIKSITKTEVNVKISIVDGRIAKEPVYSSSLDSHKTLVIDLYTAIFGGEIIIVNNNEKFKLNIPHNCQNGLKIPLKGKGNIQDEKYGNLIITIKVKIPTKLSKKDAGTLKMILKKYKGKE